MSTFEESITITIRALCADETIKVTFSDETQYRIDHHIPHIWLSKQYNYPHTRALADQAAYYIKHHSTQEQERLTKKTPKAYAALLQPIERVRIRTLASQEMRGIAQNIAHLYHQEYAALNALPQKPDSAQTLPLMLACYLEPKLCEHPGIEWMYHEWLATIPEDAKSKLSALNQLVKSQTEFTTATIDILELLTSTAQSQSVEATKEPQQPQNQQQDQDTNNDQDSEQNTQQPDIDKTNKTHSHIQDTGALKTKLSLGDEPSAAKNHLLPTKRQYSCRHDPEGYKAYTTEFDEIIKAQNLANSNELQHLRKQLDLKYNYLQSHTSRQATQRFAQKLQAMDTIKWQYQQEEGQLNHQLLSQIITDPNYATPYKKRQLSKHKETTITLLLDNSGSMRGRPIIMTALCAELLAKTLEPFQIPCEILGFTSKSWKGGESRQQWQKNGTPKHPGRLNDLKHIIYKSADMPWQRARKHFAGILQEGLLKENIDGEALEWAYKRLLKRTEKRKILVVISDGAPVDDSTIAANHSNYLDDHLKATISTIEKQNKAELYAIGIGHDVTAYYENAITLSSLEELHEFLFSQMAEIVC